ncbi:hypothetical protein [Fluviicola taffensis]|uniref:Lipoprotein n=1 Tax=Fluviicola taffensis (strain DSM 16823 / NCIMB 13979 / RW262) TaxID=755732 RepID=F2IHN3_FLUTR|nr:hypothetical protein [Fluviicola taffensis]AEA44811.1 hypothetical protein Fluta_2832 [Fluviicola taffensis DSM 16823]
MRLLVTSFCIIASVVIIASCSETPTETVSLDDISHTSDKFNDVDDKKEEVKTQDDKPKTAFFLVAFDSIYKDASWHKLDSLLFPDRFGPSKLEKWYLLGNKDSIVALHYEFKDSLRTKNAFFNWIDCYGPKCLSYQVGSQFKKQNRNSLFLVGANHLIYIESKYPIPSDKLLPILNEKEKDQNWIYMLEIPGKKKTRWSVIKEGELIELTGH